MADIWWRDGFLMRAWSTLKPFLGSQILCIMCEHKCKNLYAKISKNGPNILSSELQLSSDRYPTLAWHGRIMWNVPYLITGKILKIKWFSWLIYFYLQSPSVCMENFAIPHVDEIGCNPHQRYIHKYICDWYVNQSFFGYNIHSGLGNI